MKVRESDYLDRAFEEKAHGQTPQLFDRVRAPGGAGVYRCTVSCCASTSVTRKPVSIIPEVTALVFIGTIGSWTVWASLFSRTGIGSSFAHNHILRLRWSTSQARVSFEQLGTDVSCYGFSCYGFLSSPTWFGRGAFGAVAARNSDATRTLPRRMPSLSSGNELSLLFCALIRGVA